MNRYYGLIKIRSKAVVFESLSKDQIVALKLRSVASKPERDFYST